MSDRESDLSDDNERINEIQVQKKRNRTQIYQRVARPTTYDEDDEDEDEFSRQIRLEKNKQLQDDARQTRTRVDPDGTIYEWDPVVKGW